MAKLLFSQVAFISQEAREKAREIQVKADEEFAIEKVSAIGLYCPVRYLNCDSDRQAKIVRQETTAIDAQFDKKRKQAEVSWKMYGIPGFSWCSPVVMR